MISQVFTDRIGGVSKGPYESLNLAFHVSDEIDSVKENRELIAKRSAPTVYMNQSHGNQVAIVDGIPLLEPNVDGLITTQKGIALAVLVADCIPLLMWDEQEPCVAAVHVGRKGLMSNIASKVVNLMWQMGARDIHAQMGPSICGKCYEVGEDVYREVTALYPSSASQSDKFAFALDLPQALHMHLTSLGVKVTRSEICSYESSEHFSYRRAGTTGRNAGMIWI